MKNHRIVLTWGMKAAVFAEFPKRLSPKGFPQKAFPKRLSPKGFPQKAFPKRLSPRSFFQEALQGALPVGAVLYGFMRGYAACATDKITAVI